MLAKLAPGLPRKRTRLKLPTAHMQACAVPSFALTAGHACQQPTLRTHALAHVAPAARVCCASVGRPLLHERRVPSADFSASFFRFSSGASVV